MVIGDGLLLRINLPFIKCNFYSFKMHRLFLQFHGSIELHLLCTSIIDVLLIIINQMEGFPIFATLTSGPLFINIS